IANHLPKQDMDGLVKWPGLCIFGKRRRPGLITLDETCSAASMTGYSHLRTRWQYSLYDSPKRSVIKFSSNGICRKLIKRKKTIGGIRKNSDSAKKKSP